MNNFLYITVVFLWSVLLVNAQTDSTDNIKIIQLLNNALAAKNSNPAAAADYLVQAEKLFNTKTTDALKAKVFKEYGIINSYSGNYKLASEYLIQAGKLANANNDELTVAECNAGLGNIAYANGNLPAATNYFLNALKTFEKVDNANGLNTVYTALADLYYRQNNFSKAVEYNLKAVKIFEGSKNNLRKVTSYENIGSLFYKQNRLNDALLYYNKALQLFKEMNNKAGESMIMHNMGNIYFKLNQLQNATVCYRKSAVIAKQFNARQLLVQNYIGLGRSYFKTKNYSMAEGMFKDAIKYAREGGITIELEEAYEGIALIYDVINKQNSSSAYRLLSNDIKDSIFNDSALKKISDLQLMYEYEKKQSQLELLRKNDEINKLQLLRERQINYYLYALIALMIILIILVSVYVIQISGKNKILNKQYQELQISSNQIQLQKEELIHLNNVKDRFFTIISHDLRNNLATMRLYFDSLEHKELTADDRMITRHIRESVENTIDLLENLLVWASNEIKGIPLNTEKLNLYYLFEDNINLLNASATAKEIIIVNDLGVETFITGDKNTVNLIIRNLLSNAIKFTPFGGEILITGKRENGMQQFSISDNGIGISDDKLDKLFLQYTTASTKGTANEKGTGLGLMLCKEFVEKNKGAIHVYSKVGKGSTFSVLLPLA